MASFFQLYSHLLSKCLCFAYIVISALSCFQEMLPCPEQSHLASAQAQAEESLKPLPEDKNNPMSARLNFLHPFFPFLHAQSRTLPCTMESACKKEKKGCRKFNRALIGLFLS